MKRTAILLVLAALPAFAQRLPQIAVPSHYAITLTPNIAAETFSGEEAIEVALREPAVSITLNALEIQFDDVSITSQGRTQKAEVTLDAAKQQAMLTVAEPVSGAAAIAIRYRGILNDHLRGFYISKTSRRKYAVTQLESTDARRMFPSFDEPALKATFDVTAVIDKGDVAIGNTLIESDTPGPIPGKHTVKFVRTKRLPTYLVALLVGDFQCTEASAGGTPIRVCTTPDKVALTKFAADATAKELLFFNEWYGIRYPFDKLDIIGIPDFAAGAMENAGAITFREAALLVDEKSGSVEQKKRVAGIIAHEIAHQWFGDLVTMQWWNDVWLNEGFATWMTPKAVESLNPVWSSSATLARATLRSMSADSSGSTRPIRMGVETPAEIESVFDGIAYGKTAAMLRMVESHVGPEPFREGIRAYLKKFSFANASAEDFWNTMAATTKEPLGQVFSSFVLQPGLPVVSVQTKCEGTTTLVTLTQGRFAANNAQPQVSKSMWTIPIVAKMLDGKKNATERWILGAPSQTFTVAGCSPRVFINANGRGYYRSDYAAGALGDERKLRNDLNVAEKISLLGDEWALVRAGRKDVAEYLRMVDSLLADHTPDLVVSTIEPLTTIGDTLTTDANRPAYQAWVRRVLSPIAKEVGWKGERGESDDREELRAKVLTALVETGDDPETKRQARELAGKVVEGTATIDSQLGLTVLNMAAQTGDAALYDAMQTKAMSAKSPEEYRLFLSPLEYFSDTVLVHRSIEFAMSPAVRSQDRFGFLAAMLSIEKVRPTAWPYVKEHWNEIEKSVPTFSMSRLIGAMGRVCTASERDDVKAFFAAHPVEGAARSVRIAVERANSCIEFRDQQSPNLSAFLGASK